ncbi:succinate dehydrogenase assembly factor 3, mitochondrial-like [Physella acuta]|uniref:succinate dehydrogenase assembly factor 3, mitochondrial-like n=1 Tax=Physella acuta TaxID=109671 RepID=UPI0027DD3E1D|nr:succinate dehydrogenase assembly factor 3, mitochondrial-like [Physella acuta]
MYEDSAFTFLAMSSSHVIKIRALYKALMKLHRGLPLEFQQIGNSYVRAEFQAHKSAQAENAEIFVREWTKYYVTLAKQLGAVKKNQELGLHLSPEMLENFSDEQLGQLYELFKEATKTANPKIITDNKKQL